MKALVSERIEPDMNALEGLKKMFLGIKDKSTTNEMMAAKLFFFTKEYKFLHSAHILSDAIIKAIKHEVPGIEEYIEGRLKAPTNLPNLNQRPIINSLFGPKDKFISLNDKGQR